MRGSIYKIKAEHGYAFVAGDDGQAYFAHASRFQPPTAFASIQVGTVVEFTPQVSPKGLRVSRVEVVE